MTADHVLGYRHVGRWKSSRSGVCDGIIMNEGQDRISKATISVSWFNHSKVSKITHKSMRIPAQRMNKHPRFAKPLEEKGCPSCSLYLPFLTSLASGLWRASSASTRSGDKSKPHWRMSGERENYNGDDEPQHWEDIGLRLALSDIELSVESPTRLRGMSSDACGRLKSRRYDKIKDVRGCLASHFHDRWLAADLTSSQNRS